MAVDQNKLKALGRRRGLGAPPTDGSPGIEEEVAQPAETPAAPEKPPLPKFLRDRREGEVAPPPQPPAADPIPSPAPAAEAPQPAGKAGEGARAPGWRADDIPDAEDDEEGEAPLPRRATAPARGRAGVPAQPRRVPRPADEPRVPFTTRIAVSTKERLEDAAYSLRMKHQDIINDAIVAYLKKLGF
ncbi:hypothetical protein QMO56_23260 [Roseomonas sp. E05]|uniref:hypothetical protein n=1 Tax=Roseomonas sp. E05 TaxID=3046310 RepID=UPI0024BBDF5A|nr:hypothetical protein [Roseomonas sp. E05]MDJ0391037.1 hypothetical protein [Roseomonas sp. E05]